MLQYDGGAREYQLYIPSSYDMTESSPLLIALHGRTSTGQRMADLTSFNSRADKYGFAVVYPQGIRKQWNYLHGIAGFKEQPNDSEFLLDIVAAVSDRYNIDSNRIYVTGISNGGFMAQRLACYAPDKFAAFASVAAGGYAAMPIECVNNGPVNMLYIHGTADEKVPWKGLAVTDGNGNQQLVTMSITNSVKFWANRNQCSLDVVSKDLPRKGNSPGTRVKTLSSDDCMGNAGVVLYAIIGGGHNWPGVAGFIPPSIAGRVNMDIHASDVIWEFFSTRTLR
jgi:polyhydroxybutyrate depolymerase